MLQGNLKASTSFFFFFFFLTAPRSLQGFPGGSSVKNSSANAGDAGSIPELRRYLREGNGNPPQYSCLENPRDRGAWWAAVYGVAQSRTRLKQLSSSGLLVLGTTLESGDLRVNKTRHIACLRVYTLRRLCVLVSCCCCTKLLQFSWLRTTQLYCLAVIEVRSPKWVSLG